MVPLTNGAVGLNRTTWGMLSVNAGSDGRRDCRMGGPYFKGTASKDLLMEPGAMGQRQAPETGSPVLGLVQPRPGMRILRKEPKRGEAKQQGWDDAAGVLKRPHP